jgi:hypothetical protein
MLMLSNTDALLIAVPMIGILIAGFFRLDELIVKPRKVTMKRAQAPGADERGQRVYTDHEGTIHIVRRPRSNNLASATKKSEPTLPR